MMNRNDHKRYNYEIASSYVWGLLAVIKRSMTEFSMAFNQKYEKVKEIVSVVCAGVQCAAPQMCAALQFQSIFKGWSANME